MSDDEGYGAIAFSPDGQTLAAGTVGGSIRVWDLGQADAAPILLRGHDDFVDSLTFSPDGQRLASGGADQTVGVWIVRTDTLASMVCQTVWRNLTTEEWRQFVGEDIPYERTCPALPQGEGAPGAATPVATPT